MKDFKAVLTRIESAEAWRDSQFKDIWENALRLYRSQPEAMRDGSNIFVPYIFMMCETIKARLSESLFDERPYLTIIPVEETADKADKIQTLLDWQFVERMNVPKVFSEEIIHNLAVLGTAVQYVGWKKQVRKTKRMETVENPVMFGNELALDTLSMPIIMPERVEASYEKVEYDDPVVQDIDLFDFFVDPSSEDIETSRFCGHMEYRTKAELENLEKTAGYKINWKDLKPVSSIEGGRKDRLDGAKKGLDVIENTNGLYQVHHYWEDNRHIVIINRIQSVLEEENPFWHGMKPYDKCCYVKLPHEFYGMGIPEIAQGLQEELNTTRNLRIDYASMSLRRMWKLRKGAGVTAEDLKWRQNGVVSVDNMDDVIEIQVADIPASTWQNEATIKQDMRDATGCHDILMGLAQSNETATTTMTKDTNASIRFKSVITNVVHDLMVPLGKKCLSLNQQFMTETRNLKPFSTEDMFEITPFELDGEYDITFSGTAVDPAANKELNKQRMIEAYNIVSSNPLYQNDFSAMRAILKQLFTALEVKDVESLLPSEQNQAPQGMMPMPTEAPQGVF